MVDRAPALWRMGAPHAARRDRVRHQRSTRSHRLPRGLASPRRDRWNAADLCQPWFEPPVLGRMARRRSGADRSGQDIAGRQRRGFWRASPAVVPCTVRLCGPVDGSRLVGGGNRRGFFGESLVVDAPQGGSHTPLVRRHARDERGRSGGTALGGPTGLAHVRACPAPSRFCGSLPSNLAQASSRALRGGDGRCGHGRWEPLHRLLARGRSRAKKGSVGSTDQSDVTSLTSS